MHSCTLKASSCENWREMHVSLKPFSKWQSITSYSTKKKNYENLRNLLKGRCENNKFLCKSKTTYFVRNVSKEVKSALPLTEIKCVSKTPLLVKQNFQNSWKIKMCSRFIKTFQIVFQTHCVFGKAFSEYNVKILETARLRQKIFPALEKYLRKWKAPCLQNEAEN